MARIASATDCPCETRTSTCRSLATASSGRCFLLAISVLLRFKPTPQGGPLQGGRIRPGKGNDKGKVEGLVGYARRNFLVPVPHAASFAALNEQLLADCRRRFGDRLRGHSETVGERLARDLACFHDLPASPYEACEKRAGRVNSLSLVRYRGTDYSVPSAY